MRIGFLLDEQLPAWWRRAILRLQPTLRLWHVGDPGVPSRGTLDPELLEWCESNHCLLLTNNRRSMPGHLADHLAAGKHVPGILMVSPTRPIAEVATALDLIVGASLPGEYDDQIRPLPTL